MALDLADGQLLGPALPEPFVRFELEKELTNRKLLPKTTGEDGKKFRERWEIYRRHLRELAASRGPLRVRNKIVEPIVELLGYTQIDAADPVQTREDREAGGNLISTADGQSKLRVWTTPFNEDLVRRKLSQWFWSGVFGELYGGANETRFALDVPDVVAWIRGGDLARTVRDASFSPTRLLTIRTGSAPPTRA
jgi:hypothetical protein